MNEQGASNELQALPKDSGCGEVMATAVSDRFLHPSHLINVTDISHRLEDLERLLQVMV